MFAMAWYGWAAIAIGFVALLFVFSLRAYRTNIRREFIDFLGKTYPDVEIVRPVRNGVEVRVGESTGTIFLHKVYTAITGLNSKTDTPEAREEIFRAFADEMIGAMREADEPMSVETHGDRVMVRLVTRAWIAGLPPGPVIPHREVPGLGLFTVYVLDSPGSVRYLTDSDLDDLGLDLDGVHQLALDNLRKQSSPDLVDQVLREDKMVVVKALDSYDAARILLVPECLGEEDQIAALIPDRDTLTLVNVPADGDWGTVRKLARIPASEHLLIDRPVRVTSDGFELI